LSTDYRRGFAQKSLRRMIQFARVFPDPEIVAALSRQLGWSHFVELLPLDDALKRDFYGEMWRIERRKDKGSSKPGNPKRRPCSFIIIVDAQPIIKLAGRQRPVLGKVNHHIFFEVGMKPRCIVVTKGISEESFGKASSPRRIDAPLEIAPEEILCPGSVLSNHLRPPVGREKPAITGCRVVLQSRHG
jgi:hypothetical protein